MISTKTGIKTWSDAKQEVFQPTNNGAKNLSASDLTKMGDENIGDMLNKISDPNYVDPQKKMRTVGGNELGKDAFFKLMLTQMKHQDPTNPLKSHEMAAQLATFTQLEQMQNMNTTLEDIKNSKRPDVNYQALSFIGKSVMSDATKLIRFAGDKDHDFRFSLNGDANEVKVKISNSKGDVVRSYDLKGLKKGDNKMTWNGQDEKGNVTPIGEYKFSIEAKNMGKPIGAETSQEGLITGVNYTPEGPILMIGNQSVRISDVKKIVDPTVAGVPKPADSAGGAQKQNETQIMDSVSMSRDMLDKVKKEIQQ